MAVNSFVYLGVIVTRNFCDLFKENFDALQHKVQQDLSSWSLLPLSLVGRVNAVKMSVLPWYLYLFQSLPVFITNPYFKKLDSVILSFIWNTKKRRLCKEHLQKAKQDGGLALPNLRHCYWAANLCNLSFWAHCYSDNSVPKWVEMQKLSCSPLSLLAVLGASVPLPPNITLNNPVVHNSIKIYVQFRKHFNLQNMSFMSLSPVASNIFFSPSVLDTTFYHV